MKSILIILGKILRTALFIGLLALILPRLLTALHARPRLYSVETAPQQPVAIVFGAGLWWNGEPTPVLRDRVATAAELYQAGKVSWLLMSGSESGTYNEPQAMHDYATGLGVPEEAIVMDSAGDRTYDTCYRARTVYNIQNAILVTQSFHLPRALYTCYNLGIEAVGVAADRREYRQSSLIYWNLRELPATLFALIDVHFLHSHPLVNQSEETPEIPLVD
jgi:SanA protein